MTTSFTFEEITPAVERQSRLLLEFHQAPKPATRDAALAEIARAFAVYVTVIARSWWRRFGRIHGSDGLQDIESAGRQALLCAARRWRPSFEKPFVHFAGKWITESCKTEVARLQESAVSVPLRVRLICRELRSLESSVTKRDQFLRGMRLRESTKRAVRYFAQADSDRCVSVDSGGIDNDLPFQLSSDEASVPTQVELLEKLETIRLALLTRCSSRQRLIFFCLFPNVVLVLSDIGDVVDKNGAAVDVDRIRSPTARNSFTTVCLMLGLTRERVRQLHQETIRKVRSILRNGETVPANQWKFPR